MKLFSENIHLATASPQTQLFYFIKKQEAENVEKILHRFPEATRIHDISTYSLSALHYAAKKGSGSIVAHLIRAGSDVNCKDSQLRTPLHYAAQKGHFNVVKLLFKLKAQANSADCGGNTPLHYAVESFSIRIAHYYQKFSLATFNTKNNKGITPLRAAFWKNNTTLFQVINESCYREWKLRKAIREQILPDVLKQLAKGADVDKQIGFVNAIQEAQHSHIRLGAAGIPNFLEILNLVISHSKKKTMKDLAVVKDVVKASIIDYIFYDNLTKLRKKCNEGVCFDHHYNNIIPLHFAVSRGNPKTVKLLIELGNANVNFTDENHKTPLHHAVNLDLSNEKNCKIVKLLLTNGADIDLKDRFGESPLSKSRGRRQ